MMNICTKYGFDILIISSSYGGHRRHMNYDVQQTTDDKFVIWIIIDHEKQAKGWQKHPLDQKFQDGSQEHTTA